MIVHQRVHARAGLIGNPSDGYNGKTIAFTFSNLYAQVTLWESPELKFEPAAQDTIKFDSVEQMVEEVHRDGYYGGIRLLKAAVKKFAEHCKLNGIDLPERNFTIRYETSIPRQVGLGGSSAIITAAMKALVGFHGVQILDHVLPNVVLMAETEELGLTAGLQDRVAQAYDGLTYMDFDKAFMQEHGYGLYERLDPDVLPHLYIAYRADLSQESSRAHLRVRELYNMGDQKVVSTMNKIADLADAAREVLKAGRPDDLAELMNHNFDLRQSIYEISPANMEMIARARSAGASCKFCGSGGAVIGTYDGDRMLAKLRRVMEQGGCELIVPEVVKP